MTKAKDSPTIRDVARLAGVSVATISRYINNPALLSAETAGRVRAAMENLHYTPSPLARSLATNRTYALGLVLPEIGGDFFTPLLDGVLEATDNANLNLLIFTSRHAGHFNRAMLGPHYTDGLLIFLDSLARADLLALHAAGHPIVLIHQSAPEGIHIPTVTIENKAASYRLVSHLIETHGRRRIAFLRGPEGNEDACWREAGYREALAIHGLPVDESLITTGGFDRFVAQENLAKLIQKGVPFDAVFTGDDDAAIGALQALKLAGISVPEQVSVAGFDDQRLASFLTPPLTTVQAPTRLVGFTAANQLIRLINKEPVDPTVLLLTEIVVRSSCGC